MVVTHLDSLDASAAMELVEELVKIAKDAEKPIAWIPKGLLHSILVKVAEVRIFS